MFIISMQEAFIAIIPYFVLIGLLVLTDNIVNYFKIDLLASPKSVHHFTVLMQLLSSIIPVISISYFLAKRIKISEIISILLAITTYIAGIIYEYAPNNFTNFPIGFTVQSITIPIISTYFLKILYPFFSLKLEIKDGKTHAYRLFNYLIVFFIAFLISITFYIVIDYIMDITIAKLNPFNLHLPDIFLLIIRNIMVQIFWFFGIHGEHMVNALFGKEILFKTIMPNLTYGEFQSIFVNIGGAGVGLALLLALLLSTKDKIIKKITYISAPFAIFNIDNILIFLSVVFNRFMFIPFVLTPVLNVLLAYLALNIMTIHFLSPNFENYYIVWSTPVFVDSYLKTHSLIPSFIQLTLLIIDTTIYYYFLKRFFKYQSLNNHQAILEHNLEIDTEIKASSDIKAFQANLDIIDANAKVNEIINKLNKDNLLIHYQPKVNIKQNKIEKFEALLRYNDKGKIKGPFFLDIIEKAGLAPIIDIWVCKQIKNELKEFKKEMSPIISINLHPDTLKSNNAINKILQILRGENIIFEIIERSFIDKNAISNINKIKKAGYKLSIDDYGVGYSSLETLIKQDIDELKLDKSIINEIENKKGYLICKNTVNLCKELNIEVVAEGVENKNQLEIIKNLNIDLVQGFLFSKGISLKEAVKFAKEFELKNFVK